MLARAAPRVSGAFARWVVPPVLAAAAVLFWLAPRALTRDANAVFKRNAAIIETALPAGGDAPCLGEFSWDLASPLLYYGERGLGPCVGDAAEAARLACARPDSALVCERARVGDLAGGGLIAEEIVALRRWSLVRLRARS
jgi:hypothetical protein